MFVPPILLGIYLLAGWLAGLREAEIAAPLHFDGTIIPMHFNWEDGIPVVAWMIVPYLSLDALIVAAFLLCRDRDDVNVLSARLLIAATLAAACFVLSPMGLAFEYRYALREPWQHTWLYYPCEALWSIDRCGNRFPSLHASIAVILWPTLVAAAARPWIRIATAAWFVLVILSTLFTWQHHVADVIAGAALGGLVSMIVSRRFFSRRNSSSAPGPKSHSAAVTPNATPVHVPRSQ
jgi:membrane-associated phospholipid phosphatase